MSETGTKTELEFTAKGQDDVVSATNKVAAATNKLGKEAAMAAIAAQKLEEAQAKTAKQAEEARGKIGSYGSAVGLAGQAVSKLNPQIGGMVTLMGSATGAMQSMSTIGLGPVGIALGVVSAAVAIGSGLYDMYNQQQKAAEEQAKTEAKAMHDATFALDGHSQAIKNSLDVLDEWIKKEELKISLQNREEALAAGRAGLVAQRARENQRQDELAAARAAETSAAYRYASDLQAHNDEQTAASARQLQELTGKREEAEKKLTDAITGRQTAEAAANLQAIAALRVISDRWDAAAQSEAASLVTANNNARTRREQAAAAGKAARDAAAAIIAAEMTAAEQTNALNESNRQQRATEWDARVEQTNTELNDSEGRLKLHLDTVKALKASAAEEDYNRQQEQTAAIIEYNRLQLEDIKKTVNALGEVGNASGQAFSILGSVIEASAGSSERAQRKMLKATAAVTMTESIIKAALETAESIASFASHNYPAGVGHALAAVSFGVAATKAGIVAGGGGGAVGSGVPSAGAQASGGGSSTKDHGGGPSNSSSSGRGGDTVIINWGSSGLVYAADRAQLGRDMDRMIIESRGRLGRTGT